MQFKACFKKLKHRDMYKLQSEMLSDQSSEDRKDSDEHNNNLDQASVDSKRTNRDQDKDSIASESDDELVVLPSKVVRDLIT